MKIGLFNSCLAALLVVATLSGCTSVPDRETISPRGFSNSRSKSRSNMETVNPIRLRRDMPDAYLIGPGDTLGIYLETITGGPDQAIPIHQPDSSTNLPPATGYPFTVRDDGTISLPKLLGALKVEGLTLMETENLIRTAYVDVQKLLAQNAVITVSLIRPRTYHVVVIREDVRAADMRSSSNNLSQGKGVSFVGTEDRGTAKTLDMWAYQNDVLNALNLTGGMPSMMAKNEVIILRGGFDEVYGSDMLISNTNNNSGSYYVNGNPNIVRIPLRARPGEQLPELSQEDIILKDGDVVIVQSREAEVFYTGGMLQGGMYPIPRDFDLDVFGAMSMAGGSVAVAAGGTSGVKGNSVGSIIPPTRLLVIREVNGYQRAIKIDMKKAMTDPTERILIQPNDLIMLEYTPTEVVMNMFLSTFSLRFDLQSLWD